MFTPFQASIGFHSFMYNMYRDEWFVVKEVKLNYNYQSDRVKSDKCFQGVR